MLTDSPIQALSVCNNINLKSWGASPMYFQHMNFVNYSHRLPYSQWCLAISTEQDTKFITKSAMIVIEVSLATDDVKYVFNHWWSFKNGFWDLDIASLHEYIDQINSGLKSFGTGLNTTWMA